MTLRGSARPRPGMRGLFAAACAALIGGFVVPGCSAGPAGSAAREGAANARPGYLSVFHETGYSARIQRITGEAGTHFDLGGATGSWGTDARHHYSKDQPWNADGTLLALENRGGGSPTAILLDGETYRPLLGRSPAYKLDDFRWHPSRTHARIMIGVRENADSLVWLDPIAGSLERGWKLPLRPKGIGMSEGNPSNDGRFIALANQDSIVVVDMDPRPPLRSYAEGNRRIGPVYVIPPCSLFVDSPERCPIGNVSISPSGRYLDLKFAGTSGEANPDGHRIFEVDSVTLAIRPHRMADASERCGSFRDRPGGWIFPLKHADMAVNPFDHDEDVIIGGRSCPGSRIGRVVMVRLRDGAVTALTDPRNEASVGHVSTRNLDRPGWAYVTYLPMLGRKFDGEIVAVKMDGSKEVEPIARHNSRWKGCYRCEAHAVPSRDGRRVLWASNWVYGCPSCPDDGSIAAYVADLRPDSSRSAR
jgi:hypothetical protein